MKLFYFTLLSFLFLQGCGAIVNGTTQKVRVHVSEDIIPQVYLNGKHIPHFNGEVTIDKKIENNFLSIKADGYYEVNQYYTREINPLAATGDALWLIGAPISLAIDFYTGGIYTITPEDIRIVLRRKESK